MQAEGAVGIQTPREPIECTPGRFERLKFRVMQQRPHQKGVRVVARRTFVASVTDQVRRDHPLDDRLQSAPQIRGLEDLRLLHDLPVRQASRGELGGIRRQRRARGWRHAFRLRTRAAIASGPLVSGRLDGSGAVK